MRRFRADRRRGGAALACLLLAGCGPLARFGGDVRNHPPMLVGQWVDVAKTTPADSSIWILDARGNDDLLRVTRDSLGVAHASRTRYGYWYASAEGSVTSLCVTRRPGRDPALCTALTVARDGSEGGARRLTLVRYAGRHTRGERELVERR